MADVIGTASNATASFVTKEYPVANGVTVTDGDVVYWASGRVTNATIAGATVLGVVQGGQSADMSNVANSNGSPVAATGNSAGTVTVLVIVDPSVKVLFSQNAAPTVGGRYNLSGSTGAQTVNVSGGAGTQVECIAVSYKNNTSVGVYIFNKHEYKVSA